MMTTIPIEASLYWRIDADDGLSVRVDPVPTGFAVVFRDDDSGFVIERRTYATLLCAVAFARSLFVDTRADAGV